MYRRTYLLLLIVRIYFAFAPSYIHPDEHFQGPEIIAGHLFSFPSSLPWEFTASTPIRSVFPLYLAYGFPLTCLKWLWGEFGEGDAPPPEVVYWIIRGSFFLMTFVLEDWAVLEAAPSHRRKRQAMLLVASSYVTWVYQSHSFSNSIETLLVLWALVLMKRIRENKYHTSIFDCTVLGCVATMGVFNRITYPAFLLFPALRMISHFWRKPFSLFFIILSAAVMTLIGIYIDTSYYAPPSPELTITHVFTDPVFTPLNNLRYNSQTANLAEHGLHSRFQHFIINMFELLGPIYILVLLSMISGEIRQYYSLRSQRAIAALSAIGLLSIFPHQEARFLLPCVPLLLTCIRKPLDKRFYAVWIVFNLVFGVLMGIYHQGGIVPTQLHIPKLLDDAVNSNRIALPPGEDRMVNVIWWRTYMPPTWLLGGRNPRSAVHGIQTRDLKGISGRVLLENLETSVPKCDINDALTTNSSILQYTPTLLVSPASNTFLDPYVAPIYPEQGARPTHSATEGKLQLHLLSTYKNHINLDDMDFGDDGMIPTLRRVIGRRGLNVWLVERDCGEGVIYA